MEKELLIIAEACDVLQVGRSTLLKLLSSGEITACKVGKNGEFPRTNCTDF